LSSGAKGRDRETHSDLSTRRDLLRDVFRLVDRIRDGALEEGEFDGLGESVREREFCPVRWKKERRSAIEREELERRDGHVRRSLLESDDIVVDSRIRSVVESEEREGKSVDVEGRRRRDVPKILLFDVFGS